MKASLCIGGPEAGKRYENSRTHFHVPIRQKLKWIPENVPQTSVKNEVITYVEQVFYVDQGRTIKVWVPEKQTVSQTMELLLETYEIYRKHRKVRED